MIGEWYWLGRATFTMSRLIDVRDKLEAIKVGVVSRGFSEEICFAVIDAVNHIESDLRPARNRLVHDIWQPAEDSEGALRFNIRPSLRKFASGYRVETGSMTYVSLPEMRELVDDIVRENMHIQRLVSVTKLSPEHGGSEPLPIPPPRLHARRRLEKQRQRDIVAQEQKRRLKPSPQ